MAINLPFNSSDLITAEDCNHEALNEFPNAGKRFVEWLLSHQVEDRILSEQNVRNLQFGYGTPGTRKR